MTWAKRTPQKMAAGELSIGQAAEVLQVEVDWIRDRIAAGDITPLEDGRLDFSEVCRLNADTSSVID